jgi:hypothetical protein
MNSGVGGEAQHVTRRPLRVEGGLLSAVPLQRPGAVDAPAVDVVADALATESA